MEVRELCARREHASYAWYPFENACVYKYTYVYAYDTHGIVQMYKYFSIFLLRVLNSNHSPWIKRKKQGKLDASSSAFQMPQPRMEWTKHIFLTIRVKYTCTQMLMCLVWTTASVLDLFSFFYSLFCFDIYTNGLMKKTEIAIFTVFQNLSVYIYHAASPPAMRVLHMMNACFSLSFSFANLF